MSQHNIDHELTTMIDNAEYPTIKSGKTFHLGKNSSGTSLASVDSSGNMSVTGTLVVTGAVTTDSSVTADSVTGNTAAFGATPFTGRITTTDGVASGTVKVIGGRAYSGTSASDDLLASAGASAHVDHAQTYSIPASTLKLGSVLRIRYQVSVTDDSGTDELETKLYIGGTTLMTTTAFDPSAATDFVIGEFELVARAAPGATASCVGCGRWVTSDNGSLIHGAAIMAPTNLATNGALIVKVSSKWSSTTASTNARLAILNVDII